MILLDILKKNEYFKKFVKCIVSTNFLPYVGVLLGMLPFLIIYIIHKEINLSPNHIANGTKYIFCFNKIYYATFNPISLILPILFSVLSIGIAYIIFQSVSSASVNICSFAIINYLSHMLDYNSKIQPNCKYQQIITIAIIACLIILIVIYIGMKNHYTNQIRQNLISINNDLVRSFVRENWITYLEEVTNKIRTIKLWNNRKKPETIVRSLMKSIIQSLNNNRTEDKAYIDACNEIEKIDFNMQPQYRFLFAFAMAFVTALSLIFNGITITSI